MTLQIRILTLYLNESVFNNFEFLCHNSDFSYNNVELLS